MLARTPHRPRVMAAARAFECVLKASIYSSRALKNWASICSLTSLAIGPSVLDEVSRWTNGFSKKWRAAVMLWYCWYHFGRVHKSIRMTPAMAAGISDHVWSVRELPQGRRRY